MHAKFRIGTALIAAVLHAPLALATSPELASTIVQTAGAADSASFDGVVEAVRQTVIAAQVQGAIVELNVKAGDTVKQGQVLARIDAVEDPAPPVLKTLSEADLVALQSLLQKLS